MSVIYSNLKSHFLGRKNTYIVANETLYDYQIMDVYYEAAIEFLCSLTFSSFNFQLHAVSEKGILCIIEQYLQL